MQLSQTYVLQKPEPSLKVDFPVPVQKKTFSLKETSLKLVAQYARYLTEHYDQKVDEDMVFEGLVQKLTLDKNFKVWIKEHGDE
jgi:hypothetical protein